MHRSSGGTGRWARWPGSTRSSAVLEAGDRAQYRSVGWSILWNLAAEQLRDDRSVILDGLARAEELAVTRDLAGRHRAGCTVVVTRCSDPEIHRSRIEGRIRAIPGWHELDWPDVERSARRTGRSRRGRTSSLDAVAPLAENVGRLAGAVGYGARLTPPRTAAVARRRTPSPGLDRVSVPTVERGRTMTDHDKLYIGGEWTDPATSDRIEVISPHTEEVVGSVPEASVADVDKAVAVARETFDRGDWSAAPRRRTASPRCSGSATPTPRAWSTWPTIITEEMGSPISFSSSPRRPRRG